MSEITKNIFVSHHHLDAHKIEDFRDLIGRHGITTRDSSIYEDKLKNNYVNWEIETAAKNGKTDNWCLLTGRQK